MAQMYSSKPLFSPFGGYGTRSGGWNFVQTPTGGAWSTTPASTLRPSAGSVLGAQNVAGVSSVPPQPPPQNTDEGIDTSPFDNAWSGYLASLDQQLGGLEQQKAAQLDTATKTRDTGLANLQSQYTTTEGQVKGQQQKTLNDLTEALQGYWQQGNAMLGTRGASDSSASPMYSYALAKLGSKQRGDVMADYSSRLQNLKSVYDQNRNNLENDYNTQINQIGQWFSEAQNAVRGMQGQAALQKSQQILDYGMQLLAQQQQQYQNQKAILDQWVANKSTTLQQLMAGMNQNAQNMPGFTGLFGNIQGGVSRPQAYVPGNIFTQEETKPLFSTG